jgi:hypothetical protein
MACTIARTVEKPAKSPLPTSVAAEPKSIRMQIDADIRLAAAAGGAAHFFGDAAGLETAAAADLQGAVVAACEEAFEHLRGDHPHLDVSFTRLTDRIEIALSHAGDEAPVVGLDAIAGFTRRFGGGPAKGGASVFQGVDRVQYETRSGIAITRLTKYISKTTPMA